MGVYATDKTEYKLVVPVQNLVLVFLLFITLVTWNL